ncbi:TRAP transporter small permease [Vibrio palustris]|uniref:TRAP transporter small permease protein n=1 Tax=Vibrio palustris TaxID=1918946 RepID=A0A1R4B5T7_9VIBR|nr:TRAP transporter small permease [Vibrio palustris]SJL84288.1 2,3-diketo-L-gulonate TRAP transporter small permease protein YiaM [Vibrio palustris]
MLRRNESKLMSVMNKLKLFVDRLISWICITIIGVMTVLVTYQVISRYLFDSPSGVSEVLSRYLFIWLIFLGSAYVFGLREHMSITFVKDKFSEKTKVYLDMFIELIILVFGCSIMIFGGYNTAIRQMWQQDSALQIPMGMIYSIIPIGGVIILFYFLYHEIEFISRLKSLQNNNIRK